MSTITTRAVATVLGAGALTVLGAGVANAAPVEAPGADAAATAIETPAAPAAPALGGTPVNVLQGLPPVPLADPTLGAFDALAVVYNLVDGLR